MADRQSPERPPGVLNLSDHPLSNGLAIVFDLPLAPSQNQLLRMHWANRRKLLIDLAYEVCEKVPRQRRTKIAPALVVIERHAVGVEPDPDNLTAGAKLILDALVDASVLEDDSPQHIRLEKLWFRANTRAAQKTRVGVISLTTLA